MKGTSAIDMTHGSLLGKILLFSLPLIASNVLQLLFNAVDVVVVGQFAGATSLAAVGSTVGIIYLFLNLLIGLSVGVNVLIARYLGLTGQQKEISLVLHTSIFIAIVGGTILGAIGVFAAGWILDLTAIPADVRPLALIYIRIYFIGTPFTMLYNYGAAALRARGDTKRPLLLLFVSGLINLILNLISVITLGMGVVGVALATTISQVISAVLILYCLSQSWDELHFSWKKLCLDRRSLVDLLHIGIPAGIQSCMFSLSIVVIQSAINSYGSVVMAGCSAATSIENFLYSSMNAFHQTGQTFISQNVGAGRYDRVGPILRTCLLCTFVLGVAQSALAVGFAPQLISIYNSNPAVIQAGIEHLWVVGLPYVIFGLADVFIGSIRGYGYPVAPVIINLLATCVLRLAWIAFLKTQTVGVAWVYASYPISWVILLSALIPFWLYIRHKTRDKLQQIPKGEYT